MAIKHCLCGVMLMPYSPALVCAFECLAADMGGFLSADNPRQAAVDKGVRQATLEAESVATIERVLAKLNAEPRQAVSKAQVYWARSELRKVRGGDTRRVRWMN